MKTFQPLTSHNILYLSSHFSLFLPFAVLFFHCLPAVFLLFLHFSLFLLHFIHTFCCRWEINSLFLFPHTSFSFKPCAHFLKCMIFLTILSIYSCQLPLEFSMCPVPLASVVFLSLSQFNLVFSPISHTLFHTFLVFVFSLFILAWILSARTPATTYFFQLNQPIGISITWSKFMILMFWFAAQAFLIIINAENICAA